MSPFYRGGKGDPSPAQSQSGPGSWARVPKPASSHQPAHLSASCPKRHLHWGHVWEGPHQAEVPPALSQRAAGAVQALPGEMLWTKYLSAPKIHMKALTSNVTGSGGGAFGRRLELDELRKAEPRGVSALM